MNPILIGIVGNIIEAVIGKVKNGEKVEVSDVVESITPQVVEAEKSITDSAKETWLADLHNGGWMATSWRPLAALTSMGILVWEGIFLSILNPLIELRYPPEYVSQAALYTLLTLIGARGIEKINIARRR